MRKFLIAASFVGATAAASLATVQPALARGSCESSKQNDRVTGTVLGGVVGALAGGAIGGDATGALVGGAAGAVGGNVIAGRRAGNCPEYYGRSYNRRYRDRDYNQRSYRRTAYNNRCGWQDQSYRDAYGNVVHRQVQVCR